MVLDFFLIYLVRGREMLGNIHGGNEVKKIIKHLYNNTKSLIIN